MVPQKAPCRVQNRGSTLSLFYLPENTQGDDKEECDGQGSGKTDGNDGHCVCERKRGESS